MGNGACFGCLCHSCANNVDNLMMDGKECTNHCFYCDDCMGKDGANRPIHKCGDYKITNMQAERKRKYFKKVSK